MANSKIFIVSGPSGAGEDAIINGLEKRISIERIVTTTTRKMRPGESDGNPYYFISKEEFNKRLGAGEFIEHAEQYNGNLYGVSAEEIARVEKSGKVGIWKIEYKGVISVKKMRPDIKAIFINARSLEILENRIRNRDVVSDQYIKERMEYTKQWLQHTDIYDYKIINEEGKLDEAIEKVANIIKEELAK